MGYASSGTIEGGMSGALAGYAVGGPVGAGIGAVVGGVGGYLSGGETDRKNARIRSGLYEQVGNLQEKHGEIDAYYTDMLKQAEAEDKLETEGLFNKFLNDSVTMEGNTNQLIGQTDFATHGTVNKAHTKQVESLKDWMNLARETQENKFSTEQTEINMAQNEAHDEVDNLIESLRIQALGL
jgi:hypothetical protein